MRCQRRGRSGGVRDLLQTLLHLVLAEVDLTGSRRRAHRGGGKRLRDGNEAHRRRDRGQRRARRLLEPPAHAPPGCGHLRGIDRHYFFIAPMNCFTSSACGPLGSAAR